MTEDLLCVDCPEYERTGDTFGRCKIDGSIMAFYWSCDKTEEHKKWLERIKLFCD